MTMSVKKTFTAIAVLPAQMDQKLGRRWRDAAVLGLLALLFLFARYWYSRRFGLYEDDLTIIPRAGQLSLAELFRLCWNYFIQMSGHARPLSDIFIYILSFLGWKLGGMWGLYWMGYTVQLVNIILFFVLVNRLAGLRWAALTGIGYVLFSADATQAFLTHSLGVHPSIALLLLSLHVYISPGLKAWRWPLAYGLAFVILFSYETPFTVFLAAPLLCLPWDRRWLRQALVHLVIVGLMLGGVMLFRTLIGEGRVLEASLPVMLSQSLVRMLRGPFVGLGSYGIRSIAALSGFGSPPVAAFSLLGFFLTGLILILGRQVDTSPQSPDWRTVLRLVVIGGVMLVFAYPLTLTVDPGTLYGRGTRAHTAAGLGAALLWAAAAQAVLAASQAKFPRLGSFAVALAAAPLLGFGFLVQVDYIHAWQYQREFWTQLVQTVDGYAEGDVILVEPGLFSHDSEYIEANTWNMPRVLEQIYTFPASWTTPPRVYRLHLHWENTILAPDGRLDLQVDAVYAPTSLFQTVSPERIVFIQNDDRGMRQAGAQLVLNSRVLNLRPPEKGTAAPDKGFLYPYLIQDPQN